MDSTAPAPTPTPAQDVQSQTISVQAHASASWPELLPTNLTGRFTWLILVAAAGLNIWALARFWGANPGYADRLLVLLGAGYAAVVSASDWLSRPNSPRPWLGVPAVLVGALTFPVGVYLLIQIGARPILLWWLTLSIIVAAGGLILSRLGFSRLRASLFCLLFPLFALPVPLRILYPLQEQLQRVTTSASHTLLTALAQEVQREGFVLSLPSGRLRVEEACSGIQSLTALTAVAGFIAFLRGYGPIRGILLVLLAIPAVVAVNVLRVVLSGLIQENFGVDYVIGVWHEALGLATVLCGLFGVLCISSLLGRSSDEESAPDAVPQTLNSELPAIHRGWNLLLCLVLLASALVTGLTSYRGISELEKTTQSAPLAELPLKIEGWNGLDRPIPESVSDLLAPDQFVYRVYTNNIGRSVHVWIMFWNTGAAIKGYHHPDVCWGNQGFSASEQWVEELKVPASTGPNGLVPATAREFRQGTEKQIVMYWTQEGRRIWTNQDEKAASAGMINSSWWGHRWVGDLLGLRTESGGPRIVVVTILPAAGPAARRDIADLTRQLSGELYQLCPWAAP